MFENSANNMVMPVSPMMGGYSNGGFGNGFCGDGAWWLLVLFLFAANNGWGGNFGANNGPIPYMMNSNTNNDLQRGFDQQAVMNGINSINSSICSGFSNAEVAANSRQIADMQQNFANQTAMTNGFFGLQSQLSQCCCDNRLATANLNSTILSENCADRAALSDGIRDLLVNNTANTQRLVDTTNAAVQGVMDKICQLELDAKNDKIAQLQSDLAAARSEASQNQQTLRLEQYIRPAPIPAYTVQNPNCCYNNTGCGCA